MFVRLARRVLTPAAPRYTRAASSAKVFEAAARGAVVDRRGLRRGATAASAPVEPVGAALQDSPAPGEGLDFLDLQGLVEKLRCELPAKPEVGAPIDDSVKAKVEAILKKTRLNPREWQQHAIFRKGRYTRSIVGHSPGQFVALLLCWERGQQSPIHDHAGAHCFVKLLSGELREERFDWAPEGEKPPLIGDGRMDAANDVSFMHDSVGLHRISNPNSDVPAVSLHIYSPPFSQCQIFPPTGAPPKTASMISANTPEKPDVKFRPAPSLADLCTSLKSYEPDGGSAAPDQFKVLDMLHGVELDSVEWAMHCSPAHFSEFKPVQHLVYHDDNFSVLVSCWSPDQELPPHAVGRGRQMWMKVMHGSLQYQAMGTGLMPWEELQDDDPESTLPEGSASILRECGHKLHRFANTNAEEPAVSISIFSPPLTQFTFHTPEGIERKDVPVLTALSGSETVNDMDVAASLASASGLSRTAGRKFLSFQRLTTFLDQAFASKDFCDDRIATLLQKAVFDPAEWRLCLANSVTSSASVLDEDHADEPRQVLVAQRSQYVVFVTFWEHGQSWWSHADGLVQPQQGSGSHLHSAEPCSSWTLVLEGELQERLYASAEDRTPTSLLRVGTLKEESISYLDGSSVAHVSCASDAPCVSLHIEASPSTTSRSAAPLPPFPKAKRVAPEQVRNGYMPAQTPLLPNVTAARSQAK